MSSQSKSSELVLGSQPHRHHSYLETSGGGVKSIWPSHQTSSHSILHINAVQASQSVDPQLLISGGGYIEFVLPRHHKRLHALHLEIRVQNSDTVDAKSIGTVFQTVERVEYYIGSNFLGSVDSWAAHLKHCLTNTADTINATKVCSNLAISGTGDHYGISDAQLGVGESRTLLLNVTEMTYGWIPGLFAEDVRLRVFFNKENVFSNGIGDILLQQARMLLESETMDQAAVDEEREVYASGKLTFRYAEPRVQRIPKTFTPGLSYTVSLQNLSGNFGMIFVAALPILGGTVTYDTVNTPLDDLISTIYVTDSSNQITAGGLILDAHFLKCVHARNFPGQYIGKTGLIPIIATKSPFQDIVTGSHGGSMHLTARGETLHFQTGEGSASETANLVILAYHTSAVRVNANGTVTVLR